MACCIVFSDAQQPSEHARAPSNIALAAQPNNCPGPQPTQQQLKKGEKAQSHYDTRKKGTVPIGEYTVDDYLEALG
ncbi:hypothetical protein G6F63_016355 [Rhizopus arrhizus]|nr:hypothetical protein G6F63_016355 [Rhizopus arrhizus]